MKPDYYVNTGVDYSHRMMNITQFSRLRDAKEYFEQCKVSGEYSKQCGEIVRVTYENKWKPGIPEVLAKYPNN